MKLEHSNTENSEKIYFHGYPGNLSRINSSDVDNIDLAKEDFTDLVCEHSELTCSGRLIRKDRNRPWEAVENLLSHYGEFVAAFRWMNEFCVAIMSEGKVLLHEVQHSIEKATGRNIPKGIVMLAAVRHGFCVGYSKKWGQSTIGWKGSVLRPLNH